MKKINSTIAIILISITIWAQSPEKMSYQAVIRNSSNALVTNQQVSMQISILQGSETGTPVYVETQTPTTNASGLITIEFGTGTTTDNFSAIDWANGPYFIKTETDPTGGTNYTITGTSQLLSVPYALHAKTAVTITGGIPETDPVFGSSVANKITATDTTNWNNKLDSYTETQTISDVSALGNSVNTQLKDVTDPTDAQDAATKAYVDALISRINELELNSGIVVPDYLRDIDGNSYSSVKIGEQVWLTENLKTIHYADGTPILEVTGNANWDTLTATDAAYCWYDDDSVTYASTYGALYTWAVVNTNKLCPTGWHVPNDAEWTTLTDYLGGTSVAGGKLKETGTAHWNSPNTGATNETGFTALPGGYRYFNGTFGNFGNYGLWWSATELGASNAWSRLMGFDNSGVGRGDTPKELGLFVRCLRD